MHGKTSANAAKLASATLAACLISALGAGAASAATTRTPFTTEYTSAYGKVQCVGTLTVDKKYPANATEGGLEREKCTSQEPGGKLAGYFSAGEEYTGYWESDYYATIGEFGVQPSSVEIKVAKSFKSFKVISAVYPVKEAG
ncbi:MAG TPA: hypothetical protein VH081_05745 [Solirubrobacteraceae bacterium]|jgi:hypothetical protein|nr:hypothetical protein [Solirubrobacteraceae bacterium]